MDKETTSVLLLLKPSLSSLTAAACSLLSNFGSSAILSSYVCLVLFFPIFGTSAILSSCVCLLVKSFSALSEHS